MTHLWVGCFALLLVASCYVHQRAFGFGTPASRLGLLESVCQRGTMEIDIASTPTPDFAWIQGKRYSDKAPGTAVLALPAYACTIGLQGQGSALGEPGKRLARSWVACAFSQALPAAAGGCLLLIWLRRFVSARAAIVTVLGLWMGSLPLPYSTLLFSHAQVIGLISVTLWATDALQCEARRNEEAGTGKQSGRRTVASAKWRLALAGFSVGLALASEFTAGLVVAGLGVHVLRRHQWPRWAFVFSMIPPLLLIPLYSAATIGTPFDLPYSHQGSFPEMREGLYAIKWPDAEHLLRLLFGPTRGLVFWTPFLIMAGFGWYRIGAESPRDLWLTYAVPLLHVLVMSGRTWDWQAGFTISARYMAPILPLLALPCGLGVERWPKLGATLAGLSIVMMTATTVTDACPPYHIHNPLTEWVLPKFFKGEFSYNLGTEVLGLPSWGGVAVFYVLLVVGFIWLWRTARKIDGKMLKKVEMSREEC